MKTKLLKRIFILFTIIIMAPGYIFAQRGDKLAKQSSPSKTQKEEIRKGMGKTWAVLIANSAYTRWSNLEQEPYKDVARIKLVLSNYDFNDIKIFKDLKVSNFEKTLENLYRELVKNNVNSLLIYYAGHGEYNELLKKGYWIPVDALKTSRIGYLGDTTIREYMELYSQQVRHVLLIADCCFSGNVLKTRTDALKEPTPADYHHLKIDVSKNSSFGITSGRTEEPVRNQSHFALAFEDILDRNQDIFIRSEDIAYKLAKMVREVLHNQSPQYGPLGKGHKFGKFVFIRTKGLAEDLAAKEVISPSITEKYIRRENSQNKLNLADQLGIEWIFVEGGTFQMGSKDGDTDEQPVHSVTLSSFEISKYEITNAQYCQFLNDKGVNSDGSYGDTEYIDMDDPDCQINYRSGRFVVKNGKEKYPVIDVTWYGAKAFCECAGGRLPREAEWEYAARGGNRSGSFTYSGSNNLDKVGWYWDNSENPNNNLYEGRGTHIVGRKQPNELEIYDMSGNVWEWCQDWYDKEYYKQNPAKNPTGPGKGSYRVLRGGSWYGSEDNVRCTYRNDYSPDYSIYDVGFRLVR